MNPQNDQIRDGRYARLLAMALLSFASMYVLMYAMVDTPGHVRANLNQFYMAGLMTAPMVAVELLLMGRMYPDRSRNAWILAACAVALGLFWSLIRHQGGITDRQFLKSMIPHHAGAILMCERSSSRDPELVRLCREILSSQRSEIARMEAMLDAGD